MCVRRIDQNSATPIDTFQRFIHVQPFSSQNNNFTFGGLLFRAGNCVGTEISDKSVSVSGPLELDTTIV